MKANEVRLGNLHYYFIDDPINDPPQYMVLSRIESYDFDLMEQNPDDNDYRPIPITPERLKALGFKKSKSLWGSDLYTLHDVQIEYVCQTGHFINMLDIEIDYIHELQNLYFALHKKEIKIKSDKPFYPDNNLLK